MTTPPGWPEEEAAIDSAIGELLADAHAAHAGEEHGIGINMRDLGSDMLEFTYRDGTTVVLVDRETIRAAAWRHAKRTS
jgi:hypothetical protein